MDTRESPESSAGGLDPAAEAADVGYLLERLERMELLGKRVRLSDGRQGEIVHVEYEPPERVALVKTRPETPSPLTRVGLDRLSPPHLPYVTELIVEPSPQGKG